MHKMLSMALQQCTVTLCPSCWLNILVSRGLGTIHFLLPLAAPASCHDGYPCQADYPCPRPAAAAGSSKGLHWRPHSRVLKLQRICGNSAGPDSVFTFTAKSMLKCVEIGVKYYYWRWYTITFLYPRSIHPEYWINWSLGLAAVHRWTADLFWFCSHLTVSSLILHSS